MMRITGFLGLLLFSLSVFANSAINSSIYAHKIPVTGYPVILDDLGGVYIVPNNYITGSDHNFVTLDNTKHVCYLEPQEKLRALDRQKITVNIRGLLVHWICYEYDENYFVYSP